MATLHLLTARHRMASPQYYLLSEIENILVDCAEAHLVAPAPRPSYQWLATASPPLAAPLQKAMRRSIGLFHPVPEAALPKVQGEPTVLMVIGLNGSDLEALAAIPDWRQRYDLVVAYVFDCWVLEALPRLARQIDHLFIPFPEMQGTLATHLGIPVSPLPFGADVLGRGAGRSDRPVDVLSYGRNPLGYHQALLSQLGQSGSGQLYYPYPSARVERFPTVPYGPQRFDYQHSLLLGKLLRRSKAALAFSNRYTAQVESTITAHVTHRLGLPIVGYRWFEISAAGCAVLGKRPESSVIGDYLGWEDATIELPDDPQAGVEMICHLLADTKRMAAIHRRNYRENLIRNDWRHRFRAMFEQLGLPIPVKLRAQLDQLQQRYEAIS